VLANHRIGRGLFAAIGVSIATVGISTTRADLIAYEPFDYAEGTSLLGQNGGVGWTSAWGPRDGFSVPANSNVIVAGSLAGPAGLPTLGNHAFLTGETATLQLKRSFPNIGGGNGTTTWISFLGQRVGPATNPDVSAWPNNPYPRSGNLSFFDLEETALNNAPERISVGNSTTADAPNTTHYDEWSIMPQGLAIHRQGPSDHTPPQSQLSWAVLRIDHLGTHTTPDSAWLWLNPNPLVEPAKAAADVTIISGDANSLDYSSLDFVRPFLGGGQNGALVSGSHTANWRPPAEMLVDELRIGTAYADMRFVPEPGSAVLLMLGLVGAASRRR
jgi:hypothetical protein